ncbi:NAD(P)H-flavin reductase [Algibacillus agarilyticus]|uniref:NAD(P)H-flavin reductase n=1 Tax=Algibacillus agarilyticus TaxID=2234133 RepID=UPI000DCF79BC|nr:NAD(P)H-flavin reductase [Algibacillus agarilyticus]
MQAIQCTVESINNLTPYIYQIRLNIPQPLDFKAGQYLMLVLAEKDKRAFSIANSPSDNAFIELHIGAGAEDAYAMGAVTHFQEALANNTSVTIEAPAGNAYLQTQNDRPIILVAGGTGYTYTKSIAEQLFATNTTQPVYFYWGVRSQDALYDLEYWQQKASELTHFTFVPVVENNDDAWQGTNGNLLDAVLNDFASLADYDVYCAGRFEMVGKAREVFTAQGLNRDNIFGDAFAFIK